jgi:RNA polymerase sigma-70 factor (ECF subfamily)
VQDFTRLNDSELLFYLKTEEQRIKSAAFSEIYKRYSNRIYLYCRKVFGDGSYADDVFQETFLNFLKSVESGTKVDNIIGFLLKIARNLSLNQKRNNSKIFTELEDFHYIYHERQFENKELSQMIELAIELLPENYKEAFVLQVYEDFTYQEIADFLELPLPTVRNRIVRAKSKLRETLTPYLENQR